MRRAGRCFAPQLGLFGGEGTSSIEVRFDWMQCWKGKKPNMLGIYGNPIYQ